MADEVKVVMASGAAVGCGAQGTARPTGWCSPGKKFLKIAASPGFFIFTGVCCHFSFFCVPFFSYVWGRCFFNQVLGVPMADQVVTGAGPGDRRIS